MLKGILRRSFAHYLVSYILCLMLPVVVFSLLYKTIFLSAYSKQFIEKTAKSHDDAFANLDLQMNNLRQISSQILSSRQFSNVYLNENPRILTFYTLREILNIYALPNELIFDIWVFDQASGYFYNPLHLLSLNSFINYGPRYPEISGLPFTEFLASASGQTWIPETEVTIFNTKLPLLTYVAASPNSYTHSNSVLVLMIRQDVFGRALGSVMPYNGSTAAVIDSAGRIIYSLNPAMRPVLEKIMEEGTLPEEGPAVIRTGRQEYFANLWKSSQNKLTYLSLVPYGELAGTAQKYTYIFFAVVLGLVFCGSLLIFFLMRHNYRPLQNIVRYIKEYVFPNKESAGFRRKLSDIDFIRATLENINEENMSLSTKNKKHLREEMLFSLLKGNSQAGPSRLEEAGIDTGGMQYAAVIFQLQEKKTIRFEEFERLLEKTAAGFPFRIYPLEYLERNSFIGIFASSRELSCLSQTLEQICLELGKEAKSEIKAAYGNPVRQIENISLSYSQAKTALGCQIQKVHQRILGFQDMKTGEVPDYLYLRSELNTLEEAIGSKNPRRTEFIVSELIDTIKNKNTSYFFAVCLCYDIINTFIREIYKIKNTVAAEIIKKHHMLFLENFDHPVENLIIIVDSLSRETMRVICRESPSPVTASRDNILKYIEENYRDSNFCVQSISDHFGLSFSNLSHQFKSYTGKNISSYISALKLGYAKELLSTSGIPVSEIAARLGYFQTSSFIKKFRTVCGMTPGGYRNQHQAENSNPSAGG
jgi:AraC-like DNA-binding protein